MLKGLAGKTVLVTGAAGNIGAEAVKRFAAEGCNVIAADLTQDAANGIAEQYDDKVVAVAADVSTPEGAKACASKAASRFGGMDLAFINAGVECKGRADTRRSTSTTTSIFGVNGGLPHRQAVNTSSSGQAGQHPLHRLRRRTADSPTTSIYNASKHAVIRLAKSLALGSRPPASRSTSSVRRRRQPDDAVARGIDRRASGLGLRHQGRDRGARPRWGATPRPRRSPPPRLDPQRRVPFCHGETFTVLRRHGHRRPHVPRSGHPEVVSTTTDQARQWPRHQAGNLRRRRRRLPRTGATATTSRPSAGRLDDGVHPGSGCANNDVLDTFVVASVEETAAHNMRWSRRLRPQIMTSWSADPCRSRSSNIARLHPGGGQANDYRDRTRPDLDGRGAAVAGASSRSSAIAVPPDRSNYDRGAARSTALMTIGDCAIAVGEVVEVSAITRGGSGTRPAVPVQGDRARPGSARLRGVRQWCVFRMLDRVLFWQFHSPASGGYSSSRPR
ncbi:MAG: SDR family oxidoreductase [Ilumatobacteraceae bacterium]